MNITFYIIYSDFISDISLSLTCNTINIFNLIKLSFHIKMQIMKPGVFNIKDPSCNFWIALFVI